LLFLLHGLHKSVAAHASSTGAAKRANLPSSTKWVNKTHIKEHIWIKYTGDANETT